MDATSLAAASITTRRDVISVLHFLWVDGSPINQEAKVTFDDRYELYSGSATGSGCTQQTNTTISNLSRELRWLRAQRYLSLIH